MNARKYFSEIYQLTGYFTKRGITKDIMHYGLLGA